MTRTSPPRPSSKQWILTLALTLGTGACAEGLTGPAPEPAAQAPARATLSTPRWNVVSAGDGRPIRSLWGSGPLDVWAVGAQGLLLHRGSTGWDTLPREANDDFQAVWGSAPDDVWVVGAGSRIHHFDGAAWSRIILDGSG